MNPKDHGAEMPMRKGGMLYPDGPGYAAGRVLAMFLRYWYLLRGSWPRFAELAFWPSMQMILWGLMSVYLREEASTFATAFGVLIAGVLLWDALFRAQLGVSVSFMEDLWSRNLGNIFMTPLRPYEWVIGMLGMSFIRTMIGFVPAVILAWVLYHYSLFSLGLPVVALFLNLIFMGWWLALLVVSVIMRQGMGTESIAWITVFLLLPISCVYYPVSTLPEILQPVALALPAAHVFEGMRGIIFEDIFLVSHLYWAMGLNLAYMMVAGLVFGINFRACRREGKLLQGNE